MDGEVVERGQKNNTELNHVSKGLSREEFKEASFGMWEKHIRPDLIFENGLLFCKSCLAFFNPRDSHSNHPREQVFQAQKFCKDHGITSNITLDEVLWKEAKLMDKTISNRVYLPSYNPIHIRSFQEEQGSYSQVECNWYKQRILVVEKESEEVKKDNSILQQENKVLKQQLDTITEKYYKEKATRDEERMKVEILISNLSQVYSRSSHLTEEKLTK